MCTDYQFKWQKNVVAHIGYSLPTSIYEAGFIIVFHTDESFVESNYHNICLFNKVNNTIIVLKNKI